MYFSCGNTPQPAKVKFFIILSARPESDTAKSAIEFCRAATNNNHTITRLYLVGRGVEASEHSHRLEQISKLNIDTVCCSDSVNKFLTNPPTCPLPIGGMAQLIEASEQSDKTLTFGQRDKP